MMASLHDDIITVKYCFIFSNVIMSLQSHDRKLHDRIATLGGCICMMASLHDDLITLLSIIRF
jgi:hypothetical protein